MSTGKKIALGLVAVIVVLVAAAVIVVPMLMDVDRYRPQVIAHIQEETGKPAEIRKLTLTIFPTLSIRVDDFALGNPPGFPEGYLLKTKRIYAVVDRDALWDRRVIITSLELNQPVITLLSDVRGRWNFENPAKAQKVSKPAANDPSSFTLGVISKVSVAGGEMKAANLLASGRPGPTFFEARSVSLDLEQVDLNAFIAATTVTRGGPAPPTSLLARLGLSPARVYAQTGAGQPAAQGTLQAASLRFGTLQATSVKTKLRLFPKQVYFDDLNFGFYGGRASGSLSFNLAGQNPRYSTNARLSGVDVAKLLEAFPDARGKMTGTMEGTMKLTGEVTHSPDPLAGMRGAGQLSIRDGKLPSLQLNKNLMLAARLTNLGPAAGDPSSFSSISADLNIANQRISSEKIVVVGNGVDVDGWGSMALAGEGDLSYEGIAKVVAGQNPVTGLLVGLSGATVADGKLTFPFTLAGTLSNPKFSVKGGSPQQRVGALEGLLGGTQGQQQTTTQEGQPQPQSPQDLVKGITGLFKKKQPTDPTQQQPKP
jgi:AsmA protein